MKAHFSEDNTVNIFNVLSDLSHSISDYKLKTFYSYF